MRLRRAAACCSPLAALLLVRSPAGLGNTPPTCTSLRFFQLSSLPRSYMPRRSTTWRSSAMGCCVPYASTRGMLRSSTKSTSFLPSGGPYVSFGSRLQGRSVQVLKSSSCEASPKQPGAPLPAPHLGALLHAVLDGALHVHAARAAAEAEAARGVRGRVQAGQVGGDGDALCGAGVADKKAGAAAAGHRLEHPRGADDVGGGHQDLGKGAVRRRHVGADLGREDMSGAMGSKAVAPSAFCSATTVIGKALQPARWLQAVSPASCAAPGSSRSANSPRPRQTGTHTASARAAGRATPWMCD